jgi:xanthine dehydrogenase molybdopterin-binding subunit B
MLQMQKIQENRIAEGEVCGLLLIKEYLIHSKIMMMAMMKTFLVVEEIVARIAGRLGLRPEVVRARNFYHGAGETNTTHYREDLGINRIQEVWSRVMTEARFDERRREIAAWNATSGRVKRGLAVTPVKFGISFTLTHYNQAGALVHIYPDGSVQVNHGGTEMGQGLNVKMLGVAMRELGLPAAKIRLMATSTDKVPNTSPTAASSGAAPESGMRAMGCAACSGSAAHGGRCRLLVRGASPVAASRRIIAQSHRLTRTRTSPTTTATRLP